MEASARAGSSAAPALSLLPANVITIFLAHFDVRKGNQIEYQYPPAPGVVNANGKAKLIDVDDNDSISSPDHAGVDLSGVEWKVLPSGGHLIEKDIIYFQPAQATATGIACFRNHKLSDAEGAVEQRGARMISVGLILRCDEQQPLATAPQQLAIVPHLANLELMADQLVRLPDQTEVLQKYYAAHAWKPSGPSSTMNGKQMKQLRMRRRRDPKNLPYDPISHMPALCGSLGALLPHVLKRLMLPNHRLLIFSPSPPLVHAAHLGYNLADLVAIAIGRSGKRSPAYRNFGFTAMVHVKGQIGVHDITALDDEEKVRQSTAKGESWIAWSTDKLLLEKPHLFDSVLDLSSLLSKASEGVLSEECLEHSSSSPKLWKVVRTRDTHGRIKAELQKEKSTTREFATFNELDAQAERHVERILRVGPDACVSRSQPRRESRSESDRNASGMSLTRRRGRHALEQEEDSHQESDTLSQWREGNGRLPIRAKASMTTIVYTFLRYWIAGWWFLPRHWRYGLPSAYVLPLGIRGDGGVRASILVMPEDESEDDFDDDKADDEEDFAATATVHGNVDQESTTTSSADTDEEVSVRPHQHLVPPDPLLAAVGAAGARRGSIAGSERKSLASQHQRARDRSLSRGQLDAEEFRSDDHVRTILSDSLWMVWSHWTTALVFGLLDLLEDKISVDDDGDDSRTLTGVTVTFKQSDMASMGLSAGSDLDVAVVETLGARYLQLLAGEAGSSRAAVRVERGWSLLRWLS